MRFHFWPAFVAAFWLTMASSGFGDEPRPKAQANPAANVIETLIDDQAVVVAHVDLTQPALARLLSATASFLPADSEVAKAASGVEAFAERFTKAGGRHLYVVVSLADLPDRSPYWLVPLANGADEEQMGRLFESFPCEVRQRVGHVLFAGSGQALARLEQPRAARPEIARAFAAAEGFAAQVFVLPTADARRVIEELHPTLPAAAGGGPSTVITRGALWLSLGINAAPHLSGRLVIQSQNHGAATAFGSHWGQWYQLLSRMAGADMAAKFAGLEGRLTPDVKGDRLLLELDAERLDQVRTMLQPSVRYLEGKMRLQLSTNHLKQIGIAMHLYTDAHKHLPPAAIFNDQGQPLLSWRVALLPQLGQEALYQEFHLDEPWDSEHNARLIERMPDVFRAPGQRDLPAGHTTYLIPVGDSSLFQGREGKRFQEITDGTSNTLMVVEAGDSQAVVWTKPEDWSIAADAAGAGLSSPYGDRLLVSLCDGAVLTLQWPLEAEVLRKLVSCNGGEPLDISALMWRGK